MPRLLLPLAMAALFVAGVVVHGPVGAVLLVLLLAFLGWLSYLSWPALDPRGRVLRVVPLCLLVALAVSQAWRG